MKRNVITWAAVVAIVLGGFAVIALAEHGGDREHGRGWRGHGFSLEHMSKTLNLTPEQETKVKPIVDQTRPQLVAIHQEAMQKARGVMDNAMSQIRPLLAPEQQKKLDDLKKAHEDMRKAHEQLRDVMEE